MKHYFLGRARARACSEGFFYKINTTRNFETDRYENIFQNLISGNIFLKKLNLLLLLLCIYIIIYFIYLSENEIFLDALNLYIFVPVKLT